MKTGPAPCIKLPRASAAQRWHVACGGLPLVVEDGTVRSSASPTDLALPPYSRPSPCPHIDQRRVRAAHLPGEARTRGAHERAPVLRGAARREARKHGCGGRGRGGGVRGSAARKAGCGLGEAVSEILSESLVVGDAGEAVAGVAGESS